VIHPLSNQKPARTVQPYPWVGSSSERPPPSSPSQLGETRHLSQLYPQSVLNQLISCRATRRPATGLHFAAALDQHATTRVPTTLSGIRLFWLRVRAPTSRPQVPCPSPDRVDNVRSILRHERCKHVCCEPAKLELLETAIQDKLARKVVGRFSQAARKPRGSRFEVRQACYIMSFLASL